MRSEINEKAAAGRNFPPPTPHNRKVTYRLTHLLCAHEISERVAEGCAIALSRC
jgi:hypothetical protein